jgi:predicted regulator of Ras-like GTPase activity (Roadblock/LC7/MglB family)
MPPASATGPMATAASAGDGLSPSDELSRALHDILQGLQAALSGILGSVLVDDGGLPLAWDLKGGADPTLIATAGAMLTRTSDRSTEILDFGSLRNVILTSDKGTIGVFRVSARTSLVVLLQPSTNNVLATVEISKALERLRGVIAPGF